MSKSEKLLILTSLYALYFTIYILSKGSNAGIGSRFLSENLKLEFVHISHTGGAAIETAASTQASIKWGACHFLQLKNQNCMNPDMSWWFDSGYKIRSKNMDPNAYHNVYLTPTSFTYHNIWLTPPSMLAQASVSSGDSKHNIYFEKDLFTMVRNPYSKVVSEYYCPINGYNKNGDKSDENDPAALNIWILQEIKKFINQSLAFQKEPKGPSAITRNYPKDSFPALFAKHFTPQSSYVYTTEGKRVVDHILHFEDGRTEFNSLMEKFEIDVHMSYTMTDSGGQLTHLDLLPETISLINNFYQEDFEAFGYKSVKSLKDHSAYSLRARLRPCLEYEFGQRSKCEREENSSTSKFKDIYETQKFHLPHSTTFMLGIMTDLSEEGAQARDRIRSTYLNNQERSGSICTWDTYKNQFDSSGGRAVSCLVPYVFIVGGNQHRPLQHTDDKPIAIERHLLKYTVLDDEGDILYLNIREEISSEESMREKAFAYFKWASQIGPVYHLDFISSIQTGSLLDTQRLLDFIDEELPPFPVSRRIYGGETQGHKDGYYATDPFYFISIDLVDVICELKVMNPSPPSQTAALEVRKLITTSAKPVQYINMNANLFWYEDVDTQNWNNRWQNEMKNLPRQIHLMDSTQSCNEFGNSTSYLE